MNKQRRAKKQKPWFWFIYALILTIIIGFSLWQNGHAGFINQAQPTATPGYQTSVTRLGDISLSISGTGYVVASQTIHLSFPISGKISEIKVQVGDQVKKGQVIAQLELDQLKQNVSDQALAVAKATKNLDDLRAQGQLNLASGEVELVAAQLRVENAKSNLHNSGDSRCAPSLTQEYYFQWVYASQAADIWEGYLTDPNTGYGYDYLIEKVTPLRKARDLAYMNYTFCQSYTEQEIQQSHANFDLAQAQLEEANASYQLLRANGGIDPQAEKIAKAALNNAQLQLIKAEEDLAGATMIAPVDGIVTAINGETGESSDTTTVVTLANTTNPKIAVYIDESDLVNIKIGCPAQVTFDSLSTQPLHGFITQVSPNLVSVQNVGMVQGLLDLDSMDQGLAKNITLGLKGTVEITCFEAKNVLIIPTQALYEPQTNIPFVYLLDSQGQPYRQEVEFGIKTAATVEILHGLQEGDRVVTTPITEP